MKQFPFYPPPWSLKNGRDGKMDSDACRLGARRKCCYKIDDPPPNNAHHTNEALLLL